MFNLQLKLLSALTDRSNSDTLRSLKARKQGIDFYSNDYLGLTHNEEFKSKLIETIQERPNLLMGATGSRLISGNSECTMETEKWIAVKHQVEAALLFPSGFVANMALLATVPQRGDTILLDECIHRSVREGARLSAAQVYKFKHNDLNMLEDLLTKNNRTTFIAVESLYSMEGDFAPLKEMIVLAERYNAVLIVDEAHALGVFGYGIVAMNKLQDRVFATVVTYGKAMGLHGAAVLGSKTLIDYLINFAASFIYTTAFSDWHAVSIQKGYEFMATHSELAEQLQQRIATFRSCATPTSSHEKSPIQTILIPTNAAVKKLQYNLEEHRILTFAVVSPTVKEGSERLRICIHSFNTLKEINQLIHCLQTNENN